MCYNSMNVTVFLLLIAICYSASIIGNLLCHSYVSIKISHSDSTIVNNYLLIKIH